MIDNNGARTDDAPTYSSETDVIDTFSPLNDIIRMGEAVTLTKVEYRPGWKGCKYRGVLKSPDLIGHEEIWVELWREDMTALNRLVSQDYNDQLETPIDVTLRRDSKNRVRLDMVGHGGKWRSVNTRWISNVLPTWVAERDDVDDDACMIRGDQLKPGDFVWLSKRTSKIRLLQQCDDGLNWWTAQANQTEDHPGRFNHGRTIIAHDQYYVTKPYPGEYRLHKEHADAIADEVARRNGVPA